MIVKITDIPPEGRDIEFGLDVGALNERVASVCAGAKSDSVMPPSYVFLALSGVSLNLQLQGSTVLVSGSASANYVTQCARCVADVDKQMDVPIQMVLKPRSSRRLMNEQAEDLHFGLYDGREIDCAAIAEEFIILSMPFSELCSKDCQGLCPSCGIDLNRGKCSCSAEVQGDERLSVFRELKI